MKKTINFEDLKPNIQRIQDEMRRLANLMLPDDMEVESVEIIARKRLDKK